MTIEFLKAYNQRKLKTGFLVDRAFRVLLPGRVVKAPGYFETPGKILVIQSHLIGDVMMSVPLLKALRRRYPSALICLFANDFAAELLSGQRFVDRVYTAPFPWGIKGWGPGNLMRLLSSAVKLRKEGFDLVIDAQIDIRNAFLMYLINGKRRLGYDIVGGSAFLTDIPDFPRDVVHLLEGRLSILDYLGADTGDRAYCRLHGKAEDEWAERFINDNGLAGKEIAAVHPGASVPEKLWGGRKFAGLLEWLRGRGLEPVLIEGPGEGPLVAEINDIACADTVTVRTGLKNLMAFFGRCRLVVCLDSAASHLASAAGTPAVVLYGPQWPHLAKPFDEMVVPVWKSDMDCRPCSYTRCIKGGNECMESIELGAVTEKIEEILSMTGKEGRVHGRMRAEYGK